MKRLINVILGLTMSICCYSYINIWEGTECPKKVKLIPYIAEGENNPAVIVCPGGSYFWHDHVSEGSVVAQWLQRNGISAFVLDYRTANVAAFIFHHRYLFRGNRYPDPQDDLRQAVKLVRERAREFSVNPHRVGAMGFSAGGHLVMSSSYLFDVDDRPDFIVPIYPVVTMTHECVHKRSRRGLLGDDKQNDAELKHLLSLERHVSSDCPPVFLVNCVDDPVVDYRNSVLLDSALTEAGVKHVYLQYKTGGHGFGASPDKGTVECRQWMDEFIKWIKSLI